MKKMIVAALALSLAVSAFAGIGIEWNAPNLGMYLHGTAGDNPEAYDTLALSQSDVFWQLIFSPDDTKDEIDITNAAGGYLKEGGNDKVLANRTIPQDTAGSWDNVLDADDGTSWLTCGINMGGTAILFKDTSWTDTGYVYQRVFGGTPDDGVWYYESDLLGLSLDYDPTSPSTTQVFNIDSESQGAILGTQILGVPEPATMSLLGLGALAMVLRRKLRK